MSPSTWVDRLDQRLFNAVTSRCLVYNACWEDPAVDREILELDATDDVLVITSAGCNALGYALKGPRWFAHDGVQVDAARLQALSEVFPRHRLVEGRHRLPYMPGIRVPYYRFVGVR